MHHLQILDFQEHIDNKITKCNRIIGIMKRLSSVISRKNLLTIYKSFVRPHLDYADIIYDNPINDSFREKIERVQYTASLVITGAIKGTSRERLYKELGLESLSARRWSHRLIFFYKIIKGISPSYLMPYLISNNNDSYNTRSCSHNKIKSLKTRTQAFSSAFFPYCITEWNKLNDKVRNAVSISIFKNQILNFIKTKENSLFGIHDILGVKLLTRLRLNFSHLNEHKFRHNFKDTINPMCSCGSDIESTMHFLLKLPKLFLQ